MSDALAHGTLPGLAAAFILGSTAGFGGRNLGLLLIGAAASGVLGVLCVQLLVQYSRLERDTAIGAVLSCFFGAGVVLMSVIQSMGTGEEGGLHHFIYGQTAAMNRLDAWLMLAVALLSLAICAAFFKEFRLVCFDETFAASGGWPVSRIDLAMMSLVVLVTVVGLQAVGLLLIVALLVIPPAGARFWTEKLDKMVAASAVIGGLSCYFGSAASALLPRLPAGAVIVLSAGAVFMVSFLFAPARGLISVMISRAALGMRIAEEHLLRAHFEQRESQGGALVTEGQELALDELRLCRNWSSAYRKLILVYMRLRGLITLRGGLPQLLSRGVDESIRKTRNHRLWEEYLMTHADVSVTHVDYSADLVEHVLSPEVVRGIEQSLKEKGELVGLGELPNSVHPLDRERKDVE